VSIKVILVDDHEIVKEGIRAFLKRKGKDIMVIGEATNGEEVLEMARNNPADVYIIDIAMPTLDGVETVKRLKEIDSNCKIIIFSMYDDEAFVTEALQYGAMGYILKEEMAEEIIFAIRDVYINKYYLSQKISKFVIKGFLGKGDHSGQNKKETILTKREIEVLQLIADGFNNKEIATHISRSVNTVHVHRNNIMKKLNIHKQADLIRYAIKEGISYL